MNVVLSTSLLVKSGLAKPEIGNARKPRAYATNMVEIEDPSGVVVKKMGREESE